MLFTVPTLILLFAISTVALPAARKKFFPEIACQIISETFTNLYIPAYNVMIWDKLRA
jgi:hypothetical protein